MVHGRKRTRHTARVPAYLGGVDTYRKTCDAVVRRGYLGIRFDGADGVRCNDGVIGRLQPDVQMVLDVIAGLACRGHIHTSLLAVDLIASGVRARQEIADTLRQFVRGGALV